MAYYCSEKFRANANQSRVDIWLIYKCTKCDNTWKLSIYKGVRPNELPVGLFDKFVNNDAALAWTYAFDRNFLKQHSCTVDYAIVEYTVESTNECSWEIPVLVHVKSQYGFDLKLSALLARMLNISVGQVKRLVEKGQITASPDINVMKHRIKANQRISMEIEKQAKQIFEGICARFCLNSPQLNPCIRRKYMLPYSKLNTFKDNDGE